MSRLNPIKIGASLDRTATFQNPDTTPQDLSGFAITWNLVANGRTYKFAEGAGIEVAANVITIALTPEQTALFRPASQASSYFEFSAAGSTKVWVEISERVEKKGTLN